MKLASAAFVLAFSVSFLNSGSDFSSLKGPYFGQTAPKDSAVVFMDGLVSTLEGQEMNAGFSPDGREFYYCARNGDEWSIYWTREESDGWTEPVPMPFSGAFTDRDFTMSPEGNRIYFGSNRPRETGGEKLVRLDVFYTERLPSGDWSEPVNAGPVINSDFGENYPSVALNGNLYFFSCRDEGHGRCDIFVAEMSDDHYEQPVPLSSAINSDRNDWDAYIAPDESYIIFSSQERPDTLGGQDLYISYRMSDGSWTPAKNMGHRVNSESGEICPSVSLDGKYFFFTSRRRGGHADIYWMTTDIIVDLEPQGPGFSKEIP
jgi:Tol biopolymer transport system component